MTTAATRHVAHLGVRALPNSYRRAALPVPDADVHVALDRGPSGEAPGCGGRRTAAEPGRRARARLLPGRHPAAPRRRHRARDAPGDVAARVDDDRAGVRGAARRGRRPGQFGAVSVDDAVAERPVRIANCSGFYGDRLAAAARDARGSGAHRRAHRRLPRRTHHAHPVEGPAAGPGRRIRDAPSSPRWSKSWEPASTAASRSSPTRAGSTRAGLAERLGSSGSVSDCVRRSRCRRATTSSTASRSCSAAAHAFAHLDRGVSLADAGVKPVTANAYLGGWGIAAALAAGADIVVCGRVTDAALTSARPRGGTAGLATTGTRSPARSSPATSSSAAPGHRRQLSVPRRARDRRLPGFPIAEVAADGSSVITKQPGTRRRGHRRYRHRAAAVRDRRARLRRAPTWSRTSTPSRSRRSGATGCGSAACAARRHRAR